MKYSAHTSVEADTIFDLFRARGQALGVVAEAGYFTDLEEGHPYKYYAAVFPRSVYDAMLDSCHIQTLRDYREASAHASPLDFPSRSPSRSESLPWESLIESGLLAQDETAVLAISAAVILSQQRFPGKIPNIQEIIPETTTF